ncbi:hypothetical protein HG537_0A09030 [Torulaspora globosa]|uniref:Acetyltransferase n=1 Tax=Torulaspora globosa TaxID=48254 RepID=A0A7H9HQM4_9SACH|nr:hypothetical protein HG537_0A09030 [Torulaspora sp. CBS 2947]
MEELKKVVPGDLYDPAVPEIAALRINAQAKCLELNQTHPGLKTERELLLRGLLGSCGKNFTFDSPFFCDYGVNIHIGENFYANYNLVILDCAEVRFGDNVKLGPNVGIYTAGHPIGPAKRKEGLEFALPVNIGHNVWVGGGVSILPGVTIGDNTVIGAGSTVTRDIPPNVIAGGVPCKVIRKITDDDEKTLQFTKR